MNFEIGKVTKAFVTKFVCLLILEEITLCVGLQLKKNSKKVKLLEMLCNLLSALLKPIRKITEEKT